MSHLTSRNFIDPSRVRRLRAGGLTHREIAKEMGISETTVTRHLKEINPSDPRRRRQSKTEMQTGLTRIERYDLGDLDYNSSRSESARQQRIADCAAFLAALRREPRK